MRKSKRGATREFIVIDADGTRIVGGEIRMSANVPERTLDDWRKAASAPPAEPLNVSATELVLEGTSTTRIATYFDIGIEYRSDGEKWQISIDPERLNSYVQSRIGGNAGAAKKTAMRRIVKSSYRDWVYEVANGKTTKPVTAWISKTKGRDRDAVAEHVKELHLPRKMTQSEAKAFIATGAVSKL